MMARTPLALAAALALLPRAAPADSPAADPAKGPSDAAFVLSGEAGVVRTRVSCTRGANQAIDCRVLTLRAELVEGSRCASSTEATALSLAWVRPGVWRSITPPAAEEARRCPDAVRVVELQYSPGSGRWSLATIDPVAGAKPGACRVPGPRREHLPAGEAGAKVPPILAGCSEVALPEP